jgi:hypothetical protein
VADLTSIFTTKTGTVTVTITDTNAAANVSVLGMSDIVYEFDLVPDKPSIDAITAQYNAVDISFYLYDEQGNDLYDRLSAATENIVTITVNHFNGETSYYRFKHTSKDVTVNELKKEVKVKCAPYRPPFTVGDVFANINYAADLLNFRRSDDTPALQSYQAMSVGRFVNRVLSEAYPGTCNFAPSANYAGLANIFTPPLMTVNTFEDFNSANIATYAGANAFVIVNIHSALGFPEVTLQNGTNVLPEDVPALDVVTSLAVAEGSIIGTGVNPFYRYRFRTTNPVTINYFDLLDLNYTRAYNGLRYYFSELNNPGYVSTGTDRNLPNMQNTNSNIPYDQTAARFISFVWQPAFPFLSKGKVGTGSVNVDGDIQPGPDMDRAYKLAGDFAYFTVLAGDSPSTITGKIRGYTKLKPYEPIEFGADVPARYQGKTFRPTFLSYNLVSDEITFKAYEI